MSTFESDHTQPKQRLGTSDERCIHCGQEYGEHTNGVCPAGDDAAEAAGAPNLDCMPRSGLDLFIRTVTNGPRLAAAVMFPAKPRGYLRATRILKEYAGSKITAMAFRERGQITSALHYETYCESLYNKLPDFARW